jgi:hypothetical protein
MMRLLILALALPALALAATPTNSFHNLSTSNLISTGAITLNGGALTVSNNTLKLNGSAVTGGTFDHSALSNVLWTASGHTGTVGRIAGFLEGGAAAYVIPGSNLEIDGSDNLNVTGLVTAAQLTGATNTATLAASGVLTNGASVTIAGGGTITGGLTFDYGTMTAGRLDMAGVGDSGDYIVFAGGTLTRAGSIVQLRGDWMVSGSLTGNIGAATLGGVALGGLVQSNDTRYLAAITNGQSGPILFSGGTITFTNAASPAVLKMMGHINSKPRLDFYRTNNVYAGSIYSWADGTHGLLIGSADQLDLLSGENAGYQGRIQIGQSVDSGEYIYFQYEGTGSSNIQGRSSHQVGFRGYWYNLTNSTEMTWGLQNQVSNSGTSRFVFVYQPTIVQGYNVKHDMTGREIMGLGSNLVTVSTPLTVTGTITGDGSGITGLVPTNRQIIAGANITVNGGASAPLTGDVTIASTASGGATVGTQLVLLTNIVTDTFSTLNGWKSFGNLAWGASPTGLLVTNNPGSGVYTNCLAYTNWPTAAWYYDMSIRFVAEVTNGTSYGIGVGIQSGNGSNNNWFSVIQNPNTGTISYFYKSGTPSQTLGGPNKTALTTNLFQLRRRNSAIEVVSSNEATGATFNYHYQGSLDSTNTLGWFGSWGYPAIYVFGGTFRVVEFKYDLYAPSAGTDWLLWGDSIFSGQVSAPPQDSMAGRFCRAVPNSIGYGAGGDHLAIASQEWREVACYAPRNVILGGHPGNDVLWGNAYFAPYTWLASNIVASGAKLWVTTPTARATDNSAATLWLKTNTAFTATKVIDLFSATRINGGGTTLHGYYNSGDGIHPNALAQSAMYYIIINALGTNAVPAGGQ